MNETIITIREASWLTDHTYTYDEVVRMMGELVAVFRGDLRVSVRVKWERREGLVQAVRIFLSSWSRCSFAAYRRVQCVTTCTFC